MWVCVWHQSEWFIMGLPPGVTPWEVQFPCIVIEHKQYYNGNVQVSRHYYDVVGTTRHTTSRKGTYTILCRLSTR